MIIEDGISHEADKSGRFDLGIVGMGKIGSALYRASEILDTYRIGISKASDNYESLIANSDVLVLCMHQREICDWLATHCERIRGNQIVVSLGAYLDFDVLDYYAKGAKVARMMTGTGIADGTEGIVWSSNGLLTQNDINTVDTTLEKLGSTKYVGERQDKIINRETIKICGKGWTAYMLAQKIESDMAEFGFSFDEATTMVDIELRAILTARAQGKGYMTISDEVTSKGGVTEGGRIGLRRIGYALSARAHGAKTRIGNIQSQFKINRV